MIKSFGSKCSLMIFAGVLACTGAETPGPGTGASQPPTKGPQEPAKDAAANGLPVAETLLDESVAAMGGADKFTALTGYYVESSLDMGALGLKGVAKGWWGRVGFYNETEMSGIGQMKIGATKEKVWRDDPVNGLRELSGKEEEQARWSATLCLVPEWRQFFKSAKTVAVKPGPGGKLAEIELISPLGDKVVLRIDLDSKLPVSQTFTQASPLGDTPTTVTFEDFREVNGLKVSFKQVVDASLMKAVSLTTKLELNPSLDGVQFDMPGAATAVKPGAPIEETKADAKVDAKAVVKGKKPADAKAAGKQDKPAP